MLKQLINTYQKFLDERLGNGTGIVALIALVILSVGITQQTTMTSYNKANVLEIQNSIQTFDKNIVTINGKKYEVIFKEIK
jgi:hypothetical protein